MKNESPSAKYTLQFILQNLPGKKARILEIGCGNGEVAVLLHKAEFSIVAIDNDEQAIELAQSRGIDARRIIWPGFRERNFDAALFIRSLHHMDDLKKSVEAACATLNRGGVLIVEDFDADFDDYATLTWFSGMCRILAASGLKPEQTGLVRDILMDGDSLDTWRHARGHHHLHTARDMEKALRTSGASIDFAPSAYFFRYIETAFPGHNALAEAVLHHERDMIASGRIRPLGRRYVCKLNR